MQSMTSMTLVVFALYAYHANATEPDSALSWQDRKMLREAVYKHELIIVTKLSPSGSPLNEMSIPLGLEEFYKKDQVGTIAELLEIIKGGRPEDSRNAAACVVFAGGKRYVNWGLTGSLDKYDDYDSDFKMSTRKQWVRYTEFRLKEVRKMPRNDP